MLRLTILVCVLIYNSNAQQCASLQAGEQSVYVDLFTRKNERKKYFTAIFFVIVCCFVCSLT